MTVDTGELATGVSGLPRASGGGTARHGADARRHLPLNVLGQCLLAGVELITARAPVLLLRDLCVRTVLLPVDSQVRLCGIALVTDITLKGLLTCVHTCVALILPYKGREIGIKSRALAMRWLKSDSGVNARD